MPPPAHALKASEDTRALCRVQRRLCSGPRSWGKGAQSGAAFGNLAFSGQICLCRAVRLWEQCRNSSVALNAGGFLAVHVCWADHGGLDSKGLFVELCSKQGFIV